MSLALVPIYVKYLGIEAYGLIGIFSILISALGLLDLGMKPALGREMARYTGGTHNEQSIWNLLRSIELISSVIVIIVALVIWLISDWLATSWVKVQTLPAHVVAQAFAIMGLVAALQFFESIYSSSLAGLQRQVVQNVIICSMATTRGLGAVGIIVWVSPTIQAFFIWQAICSCLSLILFAITVYKLLPNPPTRPRFSKFALKSVWRFASGMLTITFLALLLTQVDKILLSRMLALDSFGYYVLATTIAGCLGQLTSPITSAFYPLFNKFIVQRDEPSLINAYHQSSQIVATLTGSIAAMLIIYSNKIVLLWTGNNELTINVAPILEIVTLGSLLNCIMWIPYQMQLASAWTSLTIAINIAAVIIFVPLLLILVPIYGSVGASWVWVAINAGYCIIGIHFMFLRLIKNEKWNWYIKDTIFPISTAFAIPLILNMLITWPIKKESQIAYMFFIWALSMSFSVTTTPFVRNYLKSIIIVIFKKIYGSSRFSAGK